MTIKAVPHGHEEAGKDSILFCFHFFDHQNYTHCKSPLSNPWTIEHIGKKHGISSQYARGHGIGRVPQWFRFEEKTGNLWDLESGTKVDVEDVPQKFKAYGEDSEKIEFSLIRQLWKGQCVFPATSILTDHGWKLANELKIGDYLLSSNDEFSSVTGLGNTYSQVETCIYITESHNTRLIRHPLRVTPNTPILTRSGWKQASVLSKGQEILILGKHCEICNSIIPFWYKGVCARCGVLSATEKSQTKEARLKLSSSLKKAHKEGRHPGFGEKAYAAHKRWLENGGRELLAEQAHSRNWSKESRKKARDSMIKYIEKRGSFSFGRKAGIYWSKLEEIVGEYLKSRGNTLTPNMRIGRKYVDLFLPNKKMLVEVDGEFSHREDTREKIEFRDSYFLERYPDFKVVHIPETCVLDGSFRSMLDGGPNSFLWIPLKKVETKRLNRIRKYISIETEHGSYVAKGVVIHNTVTREGPSRLIWRFFLKLPARSEPVTCFSLSDDPIQVKQTTAFFVPCPDKDALKRGEPGENKGYLKPERGSFWNDTKNTFSDTRKIDKGTVLFYIKNGLWKFLAKGKHLKGVFVLKREGSSDQWKWQKSAGPGEEKQE